MTAPDPRLTVLVAAHACRPQYIFEEGPRYRCMCGWTQDVKWGDPSPFPAHVASVVEQHTNGRVAEVEADCANWKSRYTDAKQVIAAGTANWTATILDRDDWKARAEKAEAELAKYHAEERRELEWARSRARDDVRCPSCNLRYGERDQYGCIEPARDHHYDENELREALEGDQQ